MFEGKPVGTPDAAEYWRVVEKYGVNTLFTAPTALRAIKQHDPDLGMSQKHDISR
jgi:propionyl-CoA synthetase